MLETLQKVGILHYKMKGIVTLTIGLIFFIAGFIVSIMTTIIYGIIVSIIGIVMMVFGWLYIKSAKRMEHGLSPILNYRGGIRLN